MAGLSEAQQAQILNQLAQSGELSGLNPEVLEAIDAEESGDEAKGAGINSSNYGGYFGLGVGSNYGFGPVSRSLLDTNSASSFTAQAQMAAASFEGDLTRTGGNVDEAESIYQTGSPTGETSGGGIAVINQYLNGGSAVSVAGGNSGGPSLGQLIAGQEAPATSQYTSQYDAAQAGLNLVIPGLNNQNTQLEENTDISEALLGIQSQTTGLQEQNLSQQFGITTGQSALSGLENTEQLANTQGTLGLEQSLLGSQEQTAAGIQGLTQNQLATQQGQLNYQLPLAQQAQAGQAAAAGATNTVGNTNARNTLNEQYQVNTAGIANQSQQSALNYQGQQAGFQEQAGEYGIQGTAAQQQYGNTAAGLQLSQQGASEQYQNQYAQLQQTAASLGISQEQLQQQLQSGIQQNGITAASTADQLLQQASTAEAGQTQGYGAVLSQIGAATGLGPQAFTNALPNLYAGQGG